MLLLNLLKAALQWECYMAEEPFNFGKSMLNRLMTSWEWVPVDDSVRRQGSILYVIILNFVTDIRNLVNTVRSKHRKARVTSSSNP